MKKLIRKIVQELYDSNDVNQWSKEDIKQSMSKGKFDNFKAISDVSDEKEFPSQVESLYKNSIKKCPLLSKLEYQLEKKKDYYELTFTDYTTHQESEFKTNEYGITISIKFYTSELRGKGKIKYGTHFFIQSIVDKEKDPNRFINPEDDENAFDDGNDYQYNDEEFTDKINAFYEIPEAGDSNTFLDKHIKIICDKINTFNSYVKSTYDFDVI